jgi:hypothetical protein
LGRLPDIVNKKLTLNVPLKTEEDIEAAVKFFDDNTMGRLDNIGTHPKLSYPNKIKKSIKNGDSAKLGTDSKH